MLPSSFVACGVGAGGDGDEREAASELPRSASTSWRRPARHCTIGPGQRRALRRRARWRSRAAGQRYELPAASDDNLFGLALSGGGIRSATFALGVLQAMAGRDLLKHVDYLSTVSGGGYIGSSLLWWLSGLSGRTFGVEAI